jgi:WD40 repeat protein
LRRLLESQISQPPPAVKEAVAWLTYYRVYAWRAVDEALKNWGPHPQNFQALLVECRDWQAHLFEYQLQALRGQLQKENQKKQGITLSAAHRMAMKGLVSTADRIVYSPDGKRLATCSLNTIQLWDVDKGQECARLEGHTATVQDIAFSPDGKLLASGSRDKTVSLWEVATGKPGTVFEGHTEDIHAVVFSPDSTFLASGANDKTVRIWDVGTGKEHARLDGNVNILQGKEVLVFSSDGRLLAFPTKDHEVRLWNVETGRQQGLLEEHDKIFAYPAQAIAFSRKKDLMACYYNNNWVRLLDTKTGKENAMFQLEGARKIAEKVALSPDGTLLAISDKDNLIRVWDLFTGKAKAVIQKYSDYVDALAFTPDNGLLATAGREEIVVRLWDTHTGKEKVLLCGHEDSVNSMTINAAGNMLATTSGDRTIRLWAVPNLGQKEGLLAHIFGH